MGDLKIWDLRGRMTEVKTSLALGAGAIQSLSVSPGGGYVSFGTERGVNGLVRVATNELLGSVGMHRMPIRAVAFSRDSRRVIAGCDDGHVSVLNPKVLEDAEKQNKNKAVVNLFSVHNNWVTGLAFHPGSPNTFITTSRDKTVRLWALDKKKLLREWKHKTSTWCVSYSPTGDFFAVGGGDNSLSVYRQGEEPANDAI